MITTVGLNLSIDRTVEVERLIPYGTNRALSCRTDPGGKAVNVAVTAASLGGKAAITGFMRSESSMLFEEKLYNAGVETDFVELPGQTRVNVKVLDREAGAVTEFNETGATVAFAYLDRLLGRVKSRAEAGGWLVLTGSLPPGCPEDFYLRLIQAAPKANIALDASGAPLARAIEGKPFLIKPNRQELEALLGRELTTTEEICRGAMQLVEKGVRMAVVSLGADGAVMASESGCVLAPPLEVSVRSTVGAGDAMVAGIVVGLELGVGAEQAFIMGTAAAGAAVATEGTQAGSWELYKDFLNSISIQKVM